MWIKCLDCQLESGQTVYAEGFSGEDMYIKKIVKETALNQHLESIISSLKRLQRERHICLQNSK